MTTTVTARYVKIPCPPGDEAARVAGRLYDILETVEEPETVRLGPKGERIADRVLEERTRRIIVVYRENGEDGFIITAFLTKRTNWLTKRVAIWP